MSMFLTCTLNLVENKKKKNWIKWQEKTFVLENLEFLLKKIQFLMSLKNGGA